MCGICGIVDRNSTSGVDPTTLARVNSKLWHRGPDEGGEWVNGSVGLAMRRLAIIDLTTGQQPIFNEDGNLAIVFNGEIYNYVELHKELLSQGHIFKTLSDTEVILHAYEQFGVEALARLNGMFAIAIWDSNKQELLLARDRVGKKPVYYSICNNRVIFSSEMSSLLENPGVSREVDPVALDNYFLLGYVPAPRSIFKQVRQLGPGQYLKWSKGQILIDRYWRLPAFEPTAQDEDEAADELLELLKDAVRIRLRCDVPFGALLSGGVDSALVVRLMSQIMSVPVKTFTMGFSDPSVDESAFAAEIACHFKTEHHVMIAKAHSAIELIQKLIAHFGEPFADSSAIPTYLVSELARQHVTVALTGDGGDEVFGGYPSYRYHLTAALYRTWPAFIRSGLRTTTNLVNGRGGTLISRTKRFLNESELPVPTAWLHSRSLFSEQDLGQLYTPEFADSLSTTERGSSFLASFEYFRNSQPDSSVLNLVDYENYLPGDILVKVDRMSMANSLELRSPLLDYRIAEFSTRLPREWKWNRNGGKLILKRLAKNLLPDSALTRRKQGFIVPLGEWLKGELLPFTQEAIRKSTAGSIVRLDYCQELLDRHTRGEGGGIDRKLWTILCFLMWHEEFANAKV